MPRLLFVSILTLLVIVAGCGSTSPSAPTGTTVTGLTVGGPDAVLTGASAVYRVTAAFGDGSQRAITPSWNSSNPEVATVDYGGQLLGRAHGTTTLTATSGGQSVSKTIRVVNDYTGRWEGQFVVKQCAPQSFCAAMDVDFFSFPVALDVSQSGADESDIDARLVLTNFDLHANIHGRVTSEGHLTLAGSFPVTDSGDKVWATLDLEAWDTMLSDGAMSGGWTQRVNVSQPVFTEYLQNELATMNRISHASQMFGR
jgi:Bacterial Ig-like domain (group 2)